MQNDPFLANNMEIDSNKIERIIIISYVIKIFRIVVIIVILGYFLGIFWYILADLTLIEPPSPTQEQGFILQFDLREKTP